MEYKYNVTVLFLEPLQEPKSSLKLRTLYNNFNNFSLLKKGKTVA